MKNLKEEITEITPLTETEQREITGGMRWTGAGSKNVEMDQWTALTVGQPWGTFNGIKVVQ